MIKKYHGSSAKKIKPNFTKGLLAFLFMIFTSTLMFAQVALAPVTVNTTDSEGNLLAAKFKIFKGPNYVGEFDGNTSVDLEVGATYKLYAHYASTSTARETFVVDATGNTFNYSTTKITFHWTGGYLDYRGTNSWSSFGKTDGVWNSRELFPKDFYGNIMKFSFGKVWNDPRTIVIEMDYSNTSSIEKVVSMLQLKGHNGDPLEGGTARGGYASPTVWHVSGATNSNGLLLDMRDGSNSNLSYEMKYNNTTFQSIQQEGSFYDFQTQLITMKLETCDPIALEGGHVRWGHGTSFGTYHFTGGNTDANGETSLEFFPGTYSFEMGYNATTNVKSEWNFPADGNTLTWQSTKLTLNYDGQISYGGSTGDSRWFSQPSMEMMSGGTYVFHFRDAGRTDITISDECEMTLNGNLLRLIDSNGDGLAGGTVKYWDGAWHDAEGETDANGDLFVTSPTAPSSYQMWYKGKPNQIDGSPASPIVFQTIHVTGELNDSNGDDLVSNLTFYALSWQDLDEVNPIGTAFEGELLPGTYNFDFFYKGKHSGNINQDISVNSHVVYQTIHVTGELNDSNGDDLVSNLRFYAQSWQDLDEVNPMGTAFEGELLPGTYNFDFWYEGMNSGNINQDISVNSHVVFQTVSASFIAGQVDFYKGYWHNDISNPYEFMPGCYWFRFDGAPQVNVCISESGNYAFLKLIDSEENGLVGGTVKYWDGVWHNAVGETDENGDFLLITPTVPTSLQMWYRGSPQQKNDLSAPIVWQTIHVTGELNDSNGDDLVSNLQFFALSWQDLDEINPSGTLIEGELLPGTYNFDFWYEGMHSGNINQDISEDSHVVFQTVLASFSAGQVDFFSGYWHNDISNPYEFMPGCYWFRFDGAPQVNICITETANYVFLRLIDSEGNGLAGGTVKYYDGAWHNAEGETDVDGNILVTSPTAPSSYQMLYRGKPNQINGSPASPVVFQTIHVTGELNDSNGDDLESNLQFYALSWQNMDEVNPMGTAFEGELLPGSYNFDFHYDGMHSGNINQDISENSHVVFNTIAESFTAGQVDFYSVYWHNDIASPYEFMPGCYLFKFDGGPNTEYCIPSLDELSAADAILDCSLFSIDAGADQNVYLGYEPLECAELSWTSDGGSPPYTTTWSHGGEASHEVCPEETTTYTVTVVDANGCEQTDEVTINVTDVRCGKKLDKVEICHIPEGNPSNSHTICVSANAVAAHLVHGDILGDCGGDEKSLESSDIVDIPSEFSVYPNPITELSVIEFATYKEGKVSIELYNNMGQLIQVLYYGNAELGKLYKFNIDMYDLPSGINMCRIQQEDGTVMIKKIMVNN